MAVPVQVWEPYIPASPFDPAWRRDLQRAQEQWRGEARVWLVPHALPTGVSATARWPDGGRPADRIVNAEQLNCISVIHVDEQRRLFPILGSPDSPDSPDSSLRTVPEALYLGWLRAVANVDPHPRQDIWEVPRIEHDTLAPRRVLITSNGATARPIEDLAAFMRQLGITWPLSQGRAPLLISPETERPNPFKAQHFGAGRADQGSRNSAADQDHQETIAIPFRLTWPAPLNLLFPLGGGLDVLRHQLLMIQCLHDYADGRRIEATRVAEGWVNELTGEGDSTVELAWLLPRLMVDQDATLLDVEYRFGLVANSFPELQTMNGYQEAMNRSVRVRRTFGWLGYFWWEVYQDLRSNATVRICQHCGQFIRGGHVDRRFCSPPENLTCWRERNASAQRAARRRQKSPPGHPAS